MTVLYLLVPLAIAIAAAAVVGFVWAARRGQFDDLDTPALRVLRDDEPETSRGRQPQSDSGVSRPEGDEI